MSSRRVFVDTGAWFALQVPDDRPHAEAAATLPTLVSRIRTLVTSNLVVGETYTLLRITRGYDAAKTFLDLVSSTRKLDVAFISRDLEKHAYRLLDRYAEHPVSYVDATSFALMKAHRIRHAFAFDTDFATAGFIRIPVDMEPDQL